MSVRSIAKTRKRRRLLGRATLGEQTDMKDTPMRLEFIYDFPPKAVHDWWTDLSGTGYVGVALKAVRPFGEDGGKSSSRRPGR